MYFYSGDGDDNEKKEEERRNSNREDMDLFGFSDRDPRQVPSYPPNYGNSPAPAAPQKSNRGIKILCIVLTVLVIVSNVVTIIVAKYLTTNRPKETTNNVNDLGPVVAYNNINSVALITVTGIHTENGGIGASAGSGFVVYSGGGASYIMTNYHVVEYAVYVSGGRLTQDGTIVMTVAGSQYAGCEVIAADSKHDMALVKVSGVLIPLPAVSFADSDQAQFGEFALAIGNPYGEGLSVSQGCVSVPKISITLQGGSKTDCIQTDAVINPGNSGGPLFNKDSRVIGMNSAKMKKPPDAEMEPEGMGYAITSNTVISFINGLTNINFTIKNGEASAK